MSNKNKSKLIKRLITGALCLTLVFSINGFASVVSDNDGSAFITKAEFDSLKNNFQSQIDQYNTSIDSKIDGAIAAYLAGLTLTTRQERKLDSNRKLKFPLYSCINKEEISLKSYSINDVRYDVVLPTVAWDSADIHFDTNDLSKGVQVYKGFDGGFSPLVDNTSNWTFFWNMYIYSMTGRPGKYWKVKWLDENSGWTVTDFCSGSNYFAKDTKMRDVEMVVSQKTKSQQRMGGVLQEVGSAVTVENTRVYYYGSALGPSVRLLHNITDETTWNDIMDNQSIRVGQWAYSSGYYSTLNDKQKQAMNEGLLTSNMKITDFQSELTATGWAHATSEPSGVDLTIKGSSTWTEQTDKCNKIYSGDAMMSVSNRDTDHWIYKPTQLDGHWVSGDWQLVRTYTNKAIITNYGQGMSSPRGLQSYFPRWEYWTPLVEPTTNDTNYGENAIFTAISAKKLHWVDENDEVHTFDEGLYLGKNKKAGSLEVRLKFAEPNNRNVKCAFSKVPFTSSWTESDALTVKRSAGAGTESVKIGTYTCGTEYVITVADLEEGDKLYMNFWGDQEEYCPSIETFEMYDIMSS